MDIIIAIDPGYTTGVVVGSLTGPRDFEVVESLELEWPQRFDIDAIIDRYLTNLIEVVIEDFRLYAHAAQSQINSAFPSTRVIGIVDYVTTRRGIPLFFQPASSRQSVQIPEGALHKLGHSPHIQDAYKHLRYRILCSRRANTNKKLLKGR